MFVSVLPWLVTLGLPTTSQMQTPDITNITTCNISLIREACGTDMLMRDAEQLHDEATRISQCLTNNTQQYYREVALNSTLFENNILLDSFMCLVGAVKKELMFTGNSTISNDEVAGLFLNFESNEKFDQTNDVVYEYGCIICFVAQFHNILKYRNYYIKYVGDDNSIYESILIVLNYFSDMMPENSSGFVKSTWVQSFLDVHNWKNYSIKPGVSKIMHLPVAFVFKDEKTYFGIPAEQVGGTSGIVFLAFLYIGGWILNCVLVKIFIRHEEMRKESKLIVINVAVADILNLILHNPPIDEFLVNSIHSSISVSYIFYVIIGLNIYSVMVLSCHIYLTVLPINNRRDSGSMVLRRYSPHAHVLTAWLLATLAPIPLSFIIEENYNSSLYVLISYCVVPLCWATVFSVATSLQLGLCVESIHCGTTGQETIRSARSRSANTLVALIVVSAVSYVPFCCLPFIPPYVGEQSDDHPFLISWIFVWFNAFVNPIALYVANRDFRRYFNKYLCFCCCSSTD